MSDTNKVFYNMQLISTENGLEVWTRRYYSIRETPCYHFCIQDCNLRGYRGLASIGIVKHRYPIKRIAKENSRFAFKTKEEAYKHLCYLKHKQLHHLERQTAFIHAFKKFQDGGGTLESLDSKPIPDTFDVVHEYLTFD